MLAEMSYYRAHHSEGRTPRRCTDLRTALRGACSRDHLPAVVAA